MKIDKAYILYTQSDISNMIYYVGTFLTEQQAKSHLKKGQLYKIEEVVEFDYEDLVVEGLYIRTEYYIAKVIKVDSHGNLLLETNFGTDICQLDNISFIEDDPRKLIKEGDLVEIFFSGNDMYYLNEVLKITDTSFRAGSMVIAKQQVVELTYLRQSLKEVPNIRAIYIPNKSKKTYTEQWRYQNDSE